MKLESVPLKDDPLFCIAMLQNYLRAPIPETDKDIRHEQTIRTSAEQILRSRLKKNYPFSFFVRLLLYGWLLKNTRNAIKNRENQRFARAQGYDLLRTMVRAIGRHWREKGILRNVDDIFYLELDEVWSFIEGTSTCANLQGLIDLRKREFDGYMNTTPDDHIETFGEVYFGNRFACTNGESMEGKVIRGQGCCPGVVEGEVRIIVKPDANTRLNGQILVAPQTDPGWVMLFPSISGLIIEKGSMLSHSAIVAREMGIPTVVGVKGAIKLFKDGDFVRLNGATGIINIIEHDVM
jgi:pyruvate,water dikinase